MAAKYVDIAFIPIAKKNVLAYKKMAKRAARVWRDHGALRYRECVGEDLTPDMGGMPMRAYAALAGLGRSETLVIAQITFRSRAHRDRVNAKVMADPRMGKIMGGKPIYDMGRFTYGGFEVLIDA
ncbi:MAG TPA: DUF1428 domain-containing protein [Candidatus Thermoplasmatota archaeon]|jgi:uncharacterized protein YbaA (DUF1428 family)|nr:DUF1428 domain-containing protein [Candidatus Thermoplasmatota archaeon]